MEKEKRLDINIKIGILVIWTIFCYFIYAWITQSLGNLSLQGYLQFIVNGIKTYAFVIILMIISIVISIKK